MAEQHKPEPTLADTRERTPAHLLEAHDQLIGADSAAKILGFHSCGAFLRAVEQGRVSLALIKEPSSGKAFVSAPALAAYIAGQGAKGGQTTPAGAAAAGEQESAPRPLSVADLGALLDAALTRHWEALGAPRPLSVADLEALLDAALARHRETLGPPPLSAADLEALLDAALARHRAALGPPPRPAAPIDPELVARQVRETVAQELPTIMRPAIASVERGLVRVGEQMLVEREAMANMREELAWAGEQMAAQRADMANMREELERLAQLIRASIGTNPGS